MGDVVVQQRRLVLLIHTLMGIKCGLSASMVLINLSRVHHERCMPL